ncbi:probable ubiquitin carboxyl-terminal hydrolase FAF-X isoform X3 [Frankliniella occidentalis]|uniref:ubiquitinyl hydrolase 1 n=1 Tax=Frankliniella occidentalis TaxID=133901 RepID=A0A6J1TGA3_FRAOC|nr:probable ubiquitin carboxyl-terminal hydrolase FAF-X isoform X3 [Frankliniella occidentalis]
MTIATRGQGLPPEPNESGQSSSQSHLVQDMNMEDCGIDVEGEDSNGEPDFPHDLLATLDDKITSPRWVVPVLPEQELETLMQAAIDLSKKGLDTRSEACQRFFREGLTISFTKILTDDAVNSWKFNIQHCILQNCERLVELCVVKLADDWFPLLELLAMVFNPNSKFHVFNSAHPSESVPPGSNIPDEQIFARCPPDTRQPRGWLVDLINKFGHLGGFQILSDRFRNGQKLSVTTIYALIRPFGLCHQHLTVHTIMKYLMPIVEVVPQILDNLTDDELKKEAKHDTKNDAISAIIKACKCLVSRIPNQEEMIKNLEIFRLKIILRLLQISTFNGKMSALNEVNKVIASVTYYPNRHSGLEEEEWLTAERMARWIKDNHVLEIVLRDSMHQIQYVEKLEKILRFVIKERALTLTDLDNIWAAQNGKHEAIVKNVHDLLAKLAWDFLPEQLDHLFECFQASWKTADKKQREKLLELIRRLAEDDKDGVMAHKVLTLFWNLAHDDDVPNEIMDQALTAHVKILDYSCSQERDAQKTVWLDKCVEELKSGDKWVLPALKQIKEICCLYEPAPTMNHGQRSHHTSYRQEIIERLQQNHMLVILVTNSLTTYMDKVRQEAKANPNLDPNDYFPDKRFNHVAQVQDRLNFLRFLLKQDGQLWLCADQAKQIWQALAEEAVFPSDREACFKWFSKLMGEEPDLDPAINKDFFENNILQLDPTLLTESGMRCFERFFKAVNTKEGKLKAKRRSFMMDDVDLIGTEYLWRVVTNSADEIASRGIELLKDVNTNLGPQLQSQLVKFHESYVSECLCRLRAHYDTITILSSSSGDSDEDPILARKRLQGEAVKLCRVMKVLQEYISECDNDFNGERKILPLQRSCRGKHLTLIVRFSTPGRQSEDVEVFTHSNDTLVSLRRQVLRRIKASGVNVKLDLFVNGEPLDPAEDHKLLSQIPLRNKGVLTAKLCQANSNMPSSPDSSSDSSTGSPQHPYDGPNAEAENCLPGVLMSQQPNYVQFFFQVADLGCAIKNAALRDGARMLLSLVPPDILTVQRLTLLFRNYTVNGIDDVCVSKSGDVFGQATTSPSSFLPHPTIENMFFHPSPSQVLYNLEVMYALLMPALDTASDKALEFLYNFVKSGIACVILEMLTKPNFLPTADIATKRSAYLTLLKICKLLLTVVVIVVAHILDFPSDKLQALLDQPNMNNLVSNSQLYITTHQEKDLEEGADKNKDCDNEADKDRQYFTLLKQIMHNIPNTTDTMLWTVGVRLGSSIANQMGSGSDEHNKARPMFVQALTGKLPDVCTIQAVINLAWAASNGTIEMYSNSPDQLHVLHEATCEGKNLEQDDVLVSKEALEVLSMSLVLNVKTLYRLSKDQMWHNFIIDLVLLCRDRSIRLCAVDQILTILTWCNANPQPLQDFISLLFSVLNTTVVDNANRSHEYFQLLCRLINCAYVSKCPLPEAEALLNDEIIWLKKVRDNVKTLGETHVDEAVLEGHLGIAKELLSFMSPEKKYELGSDESKGLLLIKEVVEDFVFPSSRLMLHLQKTGQLSQDQAIPVCTSPGTLTMAFDFLVALCVGSVSNMRLLVEMLSEMFYSDRDEPLVEWDYLPPVGPRPSKGFVGLKNAGATCYMNSILQQLYMLESIRVGILSADGAATDLNEDFSGEDRIENNLDQTDSESSDDSKSADEARKEYNIGILKQVQAIFGHLAYSKLQYYVPKGLWKHFKLQGEPVNLREQQDAVEFFNSLVECVDEALKALNLEQIMIKTLGGSYSDQKICKGCPHRYSREESFSVLSVEIRNHPTLLDSLEQYVKGELLEGGDAYHCDKCDKKVVTVKRLCVKKLPPILAIQLKRFEYDYERVCPIKFNDYFEFPRDLDMEPYTVMGLAKQEGEMIDCDYDEISKDVCTKYQLTGIVVHSGQASGGHYYSYILNRETNGTAKWYKFDDGEVTECKMDDEEEMKTQCFGGDYMGEVFDHMLKRMSLRRQKRWWNAYMLYYTRLDVEEHSLLLKSLNELSLSDTKLSILKMPPAIERSVRKQNIKFMHNRNQFSPEYFHFVRKLVSSNIPSRQQHPDKHSVETETLSMLSVQLAARFLFHTGFHTKKTLRGGAMDWFDVLCHHLRAFKSVRSWFATNILFQHPHRFCEYLLACPSAEVRSAFMKIIVFLAHFSLQDGPCRPPNLNAPVVLYKPNTTLSDHLLHAVLHLLDKEVSEHGRNLTHYFSLFQTYASLGVQERTQLLNLDVPVKFMRVALDEGPGPTIKYQCPELTKLHQVVSQLIRCCDVSSKCQSSQQGQAVLPNPYVEPLCQDFIMAVRPAEAEYLFSRKHYVKKLIEDANLSEDTVKLLHFCCWENPQFSRTVLSELLWQIASAYCHELHHHMQLLLNMMLMEDSWQVQRINNALKGIPEDQDGLFTTIQRNKSQYQKRSYQCIKCLVVLFSKCEVAMNELKKSTDLRRKWALAVEWLQEELNRRPYAPNSQYSYKNWSPPTHSNESTNGFFLERSNSASMTLERAIAICPVEDVEAEMVEDDDSSQQLDKAYRRDNRERIVRRKYKYSNFNQAEWKMRQKLDSAPPAAPDVTSAPNVSPVSSIASIASDIAPDIPSDVGLDNNGPDASSSSDVGPETTSDITTESDNSTVIDVDQSLPPTNDPTPEVFSPTNKALPSSTNNLKTSKQEVDPDALIQWQVDKWQMTVVTRNSTSSVKSSEQPSPPEIIQGETEEDLSETKTHVRTMKNNYGQKPV